MAKFSIKTDYQYVNTKMGAIMPRKWIKGVNKIIDNYSMK